MKYSPSIPYRHWAIFVSVSLHILLALLLFSIIKLHKQQFSSVPATPHFILMPTQQRNVLLQQPAQQQQQKNSTPIMQRITATLPVQYSPSEKNIELYESKNIKNSSKPTAAQQSFSKNRHHSMEQARKSWQSQATTTPSHQLESTVEKQTETLLQSAFDYHTVHTSSKTTHSQNENENSSDDNFEGDAENASLTKQVNAQYSHYKIGQYGAYINYAICYELNKQHIEEAPCNLPDRFIAYITLDQYGKVLDINITSGSQSPVFNQHIIEAITAASPFRELPASYKKKNAKFPFVLYPDPSILRDHSSHIATPINFFLENPYQQTTTS